jgi:hypothetical protein
MKPDRRQPGPRSTATVFTFAFSWLYDIGIIATNTGASAISPALSFVRVDRVKFAGNGVLPRSR